MTAIPLSELIATLERLDREATPGPWEDKPRGGAVTSVEEKSLPACWTHVVYVPAPPFALGAIGLAVESARSEENAALVTALRNALPRIIALLKAGDELWNSSEEECYCADGETVGGINLAPVVCDRHRAIADWYRAARG